MTLPVACYEELLAYMRGVNELCREITSTASDHPESRTSQSLDFNDNVARRHYAAFTQNGGTMNADSVGIS